MHWHILVRVVVVFGLLGSVACSRRCYKLIDDLSVAQPMPDRSVDFRAPRKSFRSPVGSIFVEARSTDATLRANPSASPRDSALFVAVTETTNAQFKMFRPTHISYPGGVPSWSAVAKAQRESADVPDAPVGSVTPDDATAFADWLSAADHLHNYRLPTEDEWRMCCRAESLGSAGWWSMPESSFVRLANVLDLGWHSLSPGEPHYNASDGFVGAAPVGSLLPNPWGLYDMLGNVAELCTSSTSASSGLREYVALGGSYADGPGVGPASRIPYMPQPPNFGFRLVAVEKQREADRR